MTLTIYKIDIYIERTDVIKPVETIDFRVSYRPKICTLGYIVEIPGSLGKRIYYVNGITCVLVP